MKGALEPGRRKYLWFGCAIICGTLAWKTKEEAITLAMAIAGLFVLQGSWRAAAGTALIPLFLVMSRWTDIGRLYVRVGENKPLVAAGSQPSLSPGVYFLTHVKASVFSYLRLFVWPQNQNIDPLVEPVTHVYDPLFLFSIIVLLSLALGGLLAARNHGIVSFGILTLLVSPLTAYALMPLADVVAEHRIYISGLGFDLLVAWATTLCFRYAKMATALAILLLGCMTLKRNEVWKNNVTLWQDAERKSPALARPHLNLGLAYQSAGQLDAALTEYGHALSINSRLAPAYINMGVIYLARNDPASAEVMLKRAVDLAPAIAAPYINLAIIAMGRDYLEEALLLLDKAASIEDSYVIHLNKGDVLARMNRFGEAAGEYRRAATLRPDLGKQADERLQRLNDRRPSP
jgi:tetratricopeptide (TPR) repeat protein